MDNRTVEKIRTNFRDALADFSFIKVYDVMHYLNWTWGGARRPPEYSEMMGVVKMLFEDALEDYRGEMISTSSGGFEITIYNSGNVGIRFVLSRSFSD